MASSSTENEFTWGKPKAIPHKERRFYGSFFYEHEEYHLFDNVLVYDKNEPDGHIAKIMKLWEETATGEKMASLRWYIRADELPLNLQGQVRHGNQTELFLAFGKAKGVSNDNKLDCIERKCKVLCISKDPRNPQPSETDLKDSEFVYERIYNVDLKKLSNLQGIVRVLGQHVLFNKQEWLSRGHMADQKTTPTMANPIPPSINESSDGHQHPAEDGQPSGSQEKPLPVMRSSETEAGGSKEAAKKSPVLAQPPLSRSASMKKRERELLPEAQDTSAKFQDTDLEECLGNGKVVLLQNVDLTFTTKGLSELVSYAFEGCCHAQMLRQSSSFKQPTGEALLVFESESLADAALQELEDNCVVLPHCKRPLLATKVKLPAPGKGRFPGHFPLDNFKLWKQRQEEIMRHSFETCHFSDQSTVEYEMATEWRSLHEWLVRCWEHLCKIQTEERNILLEKCKKKPKLHIP